MLCPRCGSEMTVHDGLRKIYYCSTECGLCLEDLNLTGGARRLARLDDRADARRPRDRSSSTAPGAPSERSGRG